MPPATKWRVSSKPLRDLTHENGHAHGKYSLETVEAHDKLRNSLGPMMPPASPTTESGSPKSGIHLPHLKISILVIFSPKLSQGCHAPHPPPRLGNAQVHWPRESPNPWRYGHADKPKQRVNNHRSLTQYEPPTLQAHISCLCSCRFHFAKR